MTRKELVDIVAAKLHVEEDPIGAAELVAEVLGIGSGKQIDEKSAQPLLFALLQSLLDDEDFFSAAKLCWTTDQFTSEPESTREIWDVFSTEDLFLLMGAASMCLSPDTGCRKWDGSVCRADQVKPGDLLCGDDATPRKVLKTFSGEDELYEISYRGGKFVCNANHVLTLVCTWTRRNNSGRYGVSSGYTPGRIIDVPLREYLGWSRQKKRAHSLIFSAAHMDERPVTVDPYIYGAWLGDGTRVRPEITTPDGPMAKRWVSYWAARGFEVFVRWKGSCGRWVVRSTEIGDWFRFGLPAKGKRIRSEYLNNSESVRLNLLAGLIDSDGCACGAGYRITTKWEGLAEDMSALARSLGFVVSQATRKHSIKRIGFEGDYHHVFISGPVDRIPTQEKKPRRRSNRQVMAGRATRTFTVSSCGRGKFSGFELDGNHRFLLHDGVVTHNSKSFSIAVRLLLEWVLDPAYTTVQVLGPSEEHLESNFFSHLVELHRSSKIKLPGIINKRRISLDKRARRGAIRGVVVPQGKSASGRIQGSKRFPRPKPHPRFGKLSRMFIFLDEMNKVPPGIWKDIDNVMGMIQGDGFFKLGGAFNPQDIGDDVAIRAEPEKGWRDFDIETDRRWKSKRGWCVLRLDAYRSENIIHKKVIFPGLQTWEGAQRIIQNSGGYSSAGYYSMVRAAYPPGGVDFVIITPMQIHNARGDPIWVENPINVAGGDIALEGGDKALFAKGQWGLAKGIKRPPSAKFPHGNEEMFLRNGKPFFRKILVLKSLIVLDPGDTIAIGAQLKGLCENLAIKPQYLMVDRTGNGAGVHDWLKEHFAQAVRGVNFYEGASEIKIMDEDTKTPKEEYERAVGEIWFAMQKFLNFGYVVISVEADVSALFGQLTGRRYRVGKKTKVESKREYMSRGNLSPNEADAFGLMVHVVRMEDQVVVDMTQESSFSQLNRSAPYYYVDPSNMVDQEL